VQVLQVALGGHPHGLASEADLSKNPWPQSQSRAYLAYFMHCNFKHSW